MLLYCLGYARDPSADIATAKDFVGDSKNAEKADGNDIFKRCFNLLKLQNRMIL